MTPRVTPEEAAPGGGRGAVRAGRSRQPSGPRCGSPVWGACAGRSRGTLPLRARLLSLRALACSCPSARASLRRAPVPGCGPNLPA